MDPFSTRPSDWGLPDGSVFIGESPGFNDAKTLKYGNITVPNQWYLAKQNGWMGVLPWSYTDGGWENIKQGLKCKDNMNACKPSTPAKFKSIQEVINYLY